MFSWAFQKDDMIPAAVAIIVITLSGGGVGWLKGELRRGGGGGGGATRYFWMSSPGYGMVDRVTLAWCVFGQREVCVCVRVCVFMCSAGAVLDHSSANRRSPTHAAQQALIPRLPRHFQYLHMWGGGEWSAISLCMTPNRFQWLNMHCCHRVGRCRVIHRRRLIESVCLIFLAVCFTRGGAVIERCSSVVFLEEGRSRCMCVFVCVVA